jgi:hypothetical protein
MQASGALWLRAKRSADRRLMLRSKKRIQAQLRAGKGMRKIARECGVGTGTVRRIKQEMKGPFVGAIA